MNYEEKRELRLQISQLLADAGLNQKTIKDIVEKEITAKVDRAIDQVLSHLDAQSYSGSFVTDKVLEYLKYNKYWLEDKITKEVQSELSSRIISVTFNDKVQPEDSQRQ